MFYIEYKTHEVHTTLVLCTTTTASLKTVSSFHRLSLDALARHILVIGTPHCQNLQIKTKYSESSTLSKFEKMMCLPELLSTLQKPA